MKYDADSGTAARPGEITRAGLSLPRLDRAAAASGQAALHGFRNAYRRSAAADHGHRVRPGNIAKVSYRVVPQEVRQQYQQLGAPGQPGQLALVCRVPSADVMGNVDAHCSQRFWNEYE